MPGVTRLILIWRSHDWGSGVTAQGDAGGRRRDGVASASESHAAQRALSGPERTDLHDSWRRVKSAAIAVAGHLDKPYPDDARWTPWSRFLKPALDRMERAMQEHRMWGDPMNDAGIERMVALEAVDERARDVLSFCEAILSGAKEDPTATTEGAVYLAADVISRLTGQRNASALVKEAGF